MQVKINDAQFAAFKKKMGTLANIERKMKPPMTKAVEWVRDDISQYKRKSKGAFSAMASKGQKRAYWAKVSSGEARHGPNGYIRTGNTGLKWTTKIETDSDGIRGIVGNNSKDSKGKGYAQYIHSAKKPGGQQDFHAATGFMTDEKAIEKNAKRITKEFDKVVNKELNK